MTSAVAASSAYQPQSRCSFLCAATRTFIMIRLAMPPGAYITMNMKIRPR